MSGGKHSGRSESHREYVELPVDINGNHIAPGDCVEMYDGHRMKVCRVLEVMLDITGQWVVRGLDGSIGWAAAAKGVRRVV